MSFSVFFSFLISSLFSEARESKYEDFLLPAFKNEVKALTRDPENRRDKYKTNSLFVGKLDKTVKELAKDNHKVTYFVLYSQVYLC